MCIRLTVIKLVGQQIQKQFDFFEQSSARSGIDYKFTTKVEILDGGNGANEPVILETFEMYGCFLQNADYGDLNYGTNEAAQIALTIRFDNLIQTPRGTGVGTAVARQTAVNTLVNYYGYDPVTANSMITNPITNANT